MSIQNIRQTQEKRVVLRIVDSSDEVIACEPLNDPYEDLVAPHDVPCDDVML